MAVVFSLGGSVVAPEGVDVGFLKAFKALLDSLDERFVIVVGGGKVCREYQQAVRSLGGDAEAEDWTGIMATRLNAEVVRHAFGAGAVVINPTAGVPEGKYVIGAGWKPGHSTDVDAALLAEQVGATKVLNVSNVTHVYNADPREQPDAQKFETMSWAELRSLVGEWQPGMNVPFDPIAAKFCEEKGIEVDVLGADLENIRKAIAGEKFDGTRIR